MAEEHDPLDPKQLDEARKRRYKIPFDFIVAYPDRDQALVDASGRPTKVGFKLGKFKVETVGDLAKFDSMYRRGIFTPMPDLSIQVLNLVSDWLGLVEDSKPEGDKK